MEIENVSQRNAEFWNELCGSQLAKSLGVNDSTPSSLKKFDDWYLDFYPYLTKHIPFSNIRNQKVLEIGLGYGTVAQKLAESGAHYTGLDIAKGPVAMVNHRLMQMGLPGKAIRDSILNPPFEAESFDKIVAIGCLHHTGNLKVAIEQCRKLLRPGGQLIFMVYYAYSYRRLRSSLRQSAKYCLNEVRGYRGVMGSVHESERASYDTGSDGSAAPHTDWISIRSLRAICQGFSNFKAKLENIDQEPPFAKFSRKTLLSTGLPKFVGLDLYATATK